MIYLNGEYMPLEEARIPVLDRGFIFGDGVYEFVPVFARVPFRLHDHYLRLERSLAAVKIPNPLTEAALGAIVATLVAAQAADDQGVYLHITRGVPVSNPPRDHSFPKNITPTVFAMSNPLPRPTPAEVEEGIAVAVREDFRWQRNDIKSISLLANCMLRSAATAEGCAEVVLLRDGFLTEASSSNVLAVRNGVVLCPPRDHLILPGITYGVMLELLREQRIAHEVRPVREAELRSAEEVWITSSSKDVLAITTLDGKAVGNGRPGPLFRRIRPLFAALKFKPDPPAHSPGMPAHG